MESIFSLIGIVDEDIHIDGKGNGIMPIAVERSYPNLDGEYLIDKFNVCIQKPLVEHSKKIFQKNDLVSVEGYIWSTSTRCITTYNFFAEAIHILEKGEEE